MQRELNLELRSFPQLSDCDLAYIAGLFDGEGMVGVYPQSKRVSKGVRRGANNQSYLLKVAIKMGNAESVLQWLHLVFGGTKLSLEDRSTDGRARTPMLGFQIHSGEAARFLKTIRPWLKVKDKQADLALEFWGVWSVSPNKQGAFALAKAKELAEALHSIKGPASRGRHGSRGRRE